MVTIIPILKTVAGSGSFEAMIHENKLKNMSKKAYEIELPEKLVISSMSELDSFSKKSSLNANGKSSIKDNNKNNLLKESEIINKANKHLVESGVSCVENVSLKISDNRTPNEKKDIKSAQMGQSLTPLDLLISPNSNKLAQSDQFLKYNEVLTGIKEKQSPVANPKIKKFSNKEGKKSSPGNTDDFGNTATSRLPKTGLKSPAQSKFNFKDYKGEDRIKLPTKKITDQKIRKGLLKNSFGPSDNKQEIDEFEFDSDGYEHEHESNLERKVSQNEKMKKVVYLKSSEKCKKMQMMNNEEESDRNLMMKTEYNFSSSNWSEDDANKITIINTNTHNNKDKKSKDLSIDEIKIST